MESGNSELTHSRQQHTELHPKSPEKKPEQINSEKAKEKPYRRVVTKGEQSSHSRILIKLPDFTPAPIDDIQEELSNMQVDKTKRYAQAKANAEEKRRIEEEAESRVHAEQFKGEVGEIVGPYEDALRDLARNLPSDVLRRDFFRRDRYTGKWEFEDKETGRKFKHNIKFKKEPDGEIELLSYNQQEQNGPNLNITFDNSKISQIDLSFKNNEEFHISSHKYTVQPLFSDWPTKERENIYYNQKFDPYITDSELKGEVDAYKNNFYKGESLSMMRPGSRYFTDCNISLNTQSYAPSVDFAPKELTYAFDPKSKELKKTGIPDYYSGHAINGQDVLEAISEDKYKNLVSSILGQIPHHS